MAWMETDCKISHKRYVLSMEDKMVVLRLLPYPGPRGERRERREERGERREERGERGERREERGERGERRERREERGGREERGEWRENLWKREMRISLLCYDGCQLTSRDRLTSNQ